MILSSVGGFPDRSASQPVADAGRERSRRGAESRGGSRGASAPRPFPAWGAAESGRNARRSFPAGGSPNRASRRRGSSASTPTRSPPIMIAEPETTRPSNGSGVIGVAMHGKTLALKTEHAPIAAYAREHLGRLAVLPAARPDLEVVAHWS